MDCHKVDPQRGVPLNLRDECLNENLFIILQEARRLVETWREEYNERRPHSSLDGKTPNEIAREEEKLTGTSN